MSSFIFTNKDLDVENLNFLSAKRGPDHTNSYKINGFNIVYNQLKHENLHQPNHNNITILFDGQIYCEANDLPLISLYEKYGKNFVEHINGEYAMMIMDENNNIIYLYSDVFSTKPLFYSIEGNDIGIASYASELKLLGFNQPIRVKSSSIVELNLNDYSIKEYKHSAFNFDEYKTSYDDCIHALENAIKIRCDQKCAIPLSSGHDTGAIFLWNLLNNNRENHFYYVKNNREDKIVMDDRIKKCENGDFQYKIIDYFKNKSVNDLMEFKNISNSMEDFENFKNDVVVFMLSKMVSTIKKDGYDIIVSGSGADAIMSNDKQNGVYLYNLEKPFHFYSYITQHFCDEFEYIVGAYGVQLRYPFLDKFFVQEFLNLSPELKTQKYKSVIAEYLKLNNLIASKRKVGMSCSHKIHTNIKQNFILS